MATFTDNSMCFRLQMTFPVPGPSCFQIPRDTMAENEAGSAHMLPEDAAGAGVDVEKIEDTDPVALEKQAKRGAKKAQKAARAAAALEKKSQQSKWNAVSTPHPWRRVDHQLAGPAASEGPRGSSRRPEFPHGSPRGPIGAMPILRHPGVELRANLK